MYAGDIHGSPEYLGRIVQKAEAKGANYIVQVGDLGVFFPSENERKTYRKDGMIRRWHGSNTDLDEWIKKRARKGKWKTKILTCGGNHDNWTVFDELAEEQGHPDMVELYPDSGVYHVPRGTQLDLDGISHLFLGGAESTDKYRRVEGLDLWNNREEPNGLEFELFSLFMGYDEPDTIITHDAPTRVKLTRARRNHSITPNTLEDILKESGHKPKRWYFGHHHMLEKWKINGTKFYCCGLHGEHWERQ
jgi:hypothetical protein